jgi:uncharacterized protein YjiS (DUF1127 family)
MLNHIAEPAPRAAAAAFGGADRIRALFSMLARRLAASRRAAAHRKAATRLLEIDPRLLRDVGLTRADLLRAIRDGGREA